MYIHLGNDAVVPDKEIIGIFDIENTSVSKLTREYLSAASKRRSDVYVSYDMPRSFVISERDGKERIYISPISSSTIIKRVQTAERSVKNTEGKV